jgi:hypothetical protein
MEDRGEREERQRAVDQAARVYFEFGHCRVTRNFQHSRTAISLKGKIHFGRINFRPAGVDNARRRP